MKLLLLIPKKILLLATLLAVVLLMLIIFLTIPKRESLPITNTTPAPTSSSVYITRTPQKIPTFKPGFTKQTQLNYKIEFNLPEGFTLPKTVERIEVRRALSDTDITYLKNVFGVSGNPIMAGSSRYWQSSDNKKSLQIDVVSGYVQYGSDDTTNMPNRITAKQAKDIAGDYLEKLNLITIFPGSARVTIFAGSGELFETQNESAATMFEVFYVLSHNAIPIYYHFATPATISVFVDADGRVEGLRYFNIQPLRATQATILDLNQVKERVRAGDFTVVKVGGNQELIPTVGTVSITSASVIHFDDKINNYFYPAILLEGKILPFGRDISLYVSVLTN